ncbi:type IV secretion system DNA-binding domain-containing protein [Pollutimonas bauzanensis]|uniref:Type IV secretory pathway, VirD4 component, TraG/TraD family ATPase n=1 Tax=Pollutimonas bauzanensis TaxID=658167 RepID=A0A1M5YII2_9BURK|nr:type IV secretion system DNA-binding domain-containing protein [Pollutimonas bauzanensis]SHI11826.1 Type IV secretory pathway, VirD4 component, TraG/TraD family ATPase [Pollutimonas bauzanensis]
MAPDLRRRIIRFALLILPLSSWLLTAMYLSGTSPRSVNWLLVSHWLRATPQHTGLLAALAAGVVLSFLLAFSLKKISKSEGFDGAGYKRYIRGTQVVSFKRLTRLCIERNKRQVEIAGVPMPTSVENLHVLLNGATGSGKSVLLRPLIYSALKRGDRAVIVDPNGDLYSKFGRSDDVLLNPYDERTQKWMYFNEVRADFDWKRLVYSIVPLGVDANAEEWNSFGRLLLSAVSRKLFEMNVHDIDQVNYWCCEAPFKEIQAFLKGTEAQSLFAGASESTRAFDSARFVLSNKLSEHRAMPAGGFSIRDWMEHGRGSLYITWREDMKTAMKPLLSAWVDIFCSSILSMPESAVRRWWLVIDELASLEKLASLVDVLTKGRKHGVRVVAGLQAVSQLAAIYGKDMAQTLRACFRNLVVLGGSKTDAETAKEMSTALGEHEVARPEYTDSRNPGGSRGTSERLVRQTEPVVTPAQIQALAALTGYVAFAEDRPIAKFVLKPISFITKNPPFIERSDISVGRASSTSWGSEDGTTPWSFNDLPADTTQG